MAQDKTPRNKQYTPGFSFLQMASLRQNAVQIKW
jgi:hypothetical protein